MIRPGQGQSLIHDHSIHGALKKKNKKKNSEPAVGKDSSVPSTQHDPSDLELDKPNERTLQRVHFS